MDHADPERIEQGAQADGLRLGGHGAIRLVRALLDERDDDEGPMAERGFGPYLCPGSLQVGRPLPSGADLDPPGRRRPQVGDIEVRVEDLAQCPGDRRCRHQQDMRRSAARLGLELRALVHAEPVLLVDDDEAEVGEGHGLLDQGVRADDHERLP